MPMNLRKWLFAAAVLATTVFGSAASAAPITLDTFNLPAGGQGTTVGTPRTGAFPATVLPNSNANGFGTRTISYAGAGNWANGEGVFVNSPTAAIAGTFEMATAAGSVSTTTAYTAFPGVLDLTTVPANALEIDFHLVDNGVQGTPFQLTIQATNASGQTLEKTFNVANLSFTNAAQTQAFAVDNTWNLVSGPGAVSLASFSNINGLRFTFNSGQLNAADFIVAAIRARDGDFRITGNIPEPASIAVFGLLTLAGGAFARRKMKVVA